MSDIQIFQHECFGQIRIIDQNGNPWFIAVDIAKALGYEKPANAVRSHCKKVNKITINPKKRTAQDNPQPPLLIIPESDVYRLVMRSNLPDAEQFQDWVCEEVLPTIRKKGSYSMKNLIKSPNNKQKAPSLLSQLNGAKFIAKEMGLKDRDIILVLDRIYNDICGRSCLKFIETNDNANTQSLDQIKDLGQTKDIVDTEDYGQKEEGKEEVFFTATDIGKMCNPPLSAKEVNSRLQSFGLINKNDNSHNKWALTSLGESLGGKYFQGENNSYVFIKWNNSPQLIDSLNTLIFPYKLLLDNEKQFLEH